MKQIDLDDLPPRIAQTLSALQHDEELVLVREAVVVARLRVAIPPPAVDPLADVRPEEGMKEVLEQFNAMIHDEF